MFTLIKQNPAIRTLPRWLIISAVTATFILNLITFAALKYQKIDTGIDIILYVSLLWLTLSLYLILGEVGTRCSPFDMALPISARRLWLSQVSAVFLAGVAILTVTAGLTAGGIVLLWKLMGKWLLQADGIGSLAAQLSAGLILAVSLILNPKPPLQKVPRKLSHVVYSALVMVAVLMLIKYLLPYHPAAALLPLTIAVVIGYLKTRSVPDVFSLVPAQPENAAGPGLEDSATTAAEWEAATAGSLRSPAGFKWFLGQTVLRCSRVGLKKKLLPWFTMPFLFLFGAALTGIDEYIMSETLRYAYIPMAVYLLMAFTGIPLNRLGMVDALPIPRRFLFAMMILPSFIALIIGYGAGQAGLFFLEKHKDQRPELIEFFESEDDNCYYVHVPAGYCKIAWGGDVPIATSPWGEKAVVWRKSLFKPSKIKIYIPYGVEKESSLDFAALQISRATEAVYGEAISSEEIKKRYLGIRNDGRVAPKGEALTIQADFPHLREREGGPAFPVIMLMVGLLWMVLLYVYLFSFRAGISKGKKLLVHWLVVGVALLLWIGQFALAYAGLMMPHLTAGFLDIIIRRTGETLVGTLAVWIVCGLLLWGAYSFVAGRFERVEIPCEDEACG